MRLEVSWLNWGCLHDVLVHLTHHSDYKWIIQVQSSVVQSFIWMTKVEIILFFFFFFFCDPQKKVIQVNKGCNNSYFWIIWNTSIDIKHITHNAIIHDLFNTHTYFSFQNLYTHNCLYYILCFCYFVHCLFVHCSFVACVLSWCYHFIALWSFCHYNKFLVCVNIPGQ